MRSEYKVLSINPGASERLPSFSRGSVRSRRSIVPLAGKIAGMFGESTGSYLRGSAARLLLRMVAALATGGSAWLQMQGHLCVFGMETDAYGWGVAALVLSVLTALGVTGRLAPLMLACLSVISLISYAYYNGGVADFSASNQLALIYGALAAMVSVLGTGRLSVPFWLAHVVRGDRQKRMV